MRRRHALALLFLGALALGACAETPTTVGEAPAAQGLLGGLLGGGNTVSVLKRSAPLLTPEVVARTIGSGGGVIVLPRSGLTLTVPAGTVSSPTTITVTAPAGDLMGYHFAPHGIVFAKSLRAVQDLDRAELGLLQRLTVHPVAAYFQGQLLPQVTALELLPLNVWGLLGYATFNVSHFSGYVIATD